MKGFSEKDYVNAQVRAAQGLGLGRKNNEEMERAVADVIELLRSFHIDDFNVEADDGYVAIDIEVSEAQEFCQRVNDAVSI